MSVASTYASALLSTLPKESRTLDQIESQLLQLAQILESRADLRAALTGPLTTHKEKSALLEALTSRMGCHPALIRFLELAARKRRLGALPEIAGAFRAVRVESEGGVLGSLESADALSDEDVADLARAFGQRIGRTVSLSAKVNPALLAGLRITVMGKTYDGTLQTQLARLKTKLIETSVRNH
ncbi:MAG: ATP synthase F1 subunit delta [Oligoflexia bacterium]|jgi:F-type H+-transporting ATPase subunit delta